jgi:predicted RNA-binding protein with PUA-like domain
MFKNSWVFQANPKIYNLKGVLVKGYELNWRVNRYHKDICIGDKGYLWQSGKDAGIYAITEVLTEPAIMEKNKFEQDSGYDPEKIKKQALRVRIRINHVLKKTIFKRVLKDHDTLANMTVITNPRAAGSISRILPDQEIAINDLLKLHSQ